MKLSKAVCAELYLVLQVLLGVTSELYFVASTSWSQMACMPLIEG